MIPASLSHFPFLLSITLSFTTVSKASTPVGTILIALSNSGVFALWKELGIEDTGRKSSPMVCLKTQGHPCCDLIWGVTPKYFPPQIPTKPIPSRSPPSEGWAYFPNHKFWSKVQRRSSFASSRHKWQSGRQCLDIDIWNYVNIYMFHGDDGANLSSDFKMIWKTSGIEAT